MSDEIEHITTVAEKKQGDVLHLLTTVISKRINSDPFRPEILNAMKEKGLNKLWLPIGEDRRFSLNIHWESLEAEKQVPVLLLKVSEHSNEPDGTVKTTRMAFTETAWLEGNPLEVSPRSWAVNVENSKAYFRCILSEDPRASAESVYHVSSRMPDFFGSLGVILASVPPNPLTEILRKLIPAAARAIAENIKWHKEELRCLLSNQKLFSELLNEARLMSYGAICPGIFGSQVDPARLETEPEKLLPDQFLLGSVSRAPEQNTEAARTRGRVELPQDRLYASINLHWDFINETKDESTETSVCRVSAFALAALTSVLKSKLQLSASVLSSGNAAEALNQISSIADSPEAIEKILCDALYEAPRITMPIFTGNMMIADGVEIPAWKLSTSHFSPDQTQRIDALVEHIAQWERLAKYYRAKAIKTAGSPADLMPFDANRDSQNIYTRPLLQHIDSLVLKDRREKKLAKDILSLRQAEEDLLFAASHQVSLDSGLKLNTEISCDLRWMRKGAKPKDLKWDYFYPDESYRISKFRPSAGEHVLTGDADMITTIRITGEAAGKEFRFFMHPGISEKDSTSSNAILDIQRKLGYGNFSTDLVDLIIKNSPSMPEGTDAAAVVEAVEKPLLEGITKCVEQIRSSLFHKDAISRNVVFLKKEFDAAALRLRHAIVSFAKSSVKKDSANAREFRQEELMIRLKIHNYHYRAFRDIVMHLATSKTKAAKEDVTVTFRLFGDTMNTMETFIGSKENDFLTSKKKDLRSILRHVGATAEQINIAAAFFEKEARDQADQQKKIAAEGGATLDSAIDLIKEEFPTECMEIYLDQGASM